MALFVLVLPIVVALVVQHDPRWYPSADTAQIELRVRDVYHGDLPLIGLGGRIGGEGIAQGSHPGPLAFYLMAPVHWALGDTAWGLQVATAFVHAAALGTALWLIRRRGGAALFLGATAVLALLGTATTAQLLTLPWNPYLPLLWFVAFVFAVWSVTCDDLVALPIAAFAGTLCVQTHIPYAGVVAAGALVALGWVAFRLWRPHIGTPRRRVLRAVAVASALSAILWLPPVLEQLFIEESGNFARIVDYFAHPPGDLLGAGDGAQLALARFNPIRLLTDLEPQEPFVGVDSTLPGVLLLAVWVVAVFASWRMRAQELLRLHAVLAVVVAAAALAVSRILGPPFGYLSLWCVCITALLVLAVGWTAALVVSRYTSLGGTRLRRVGAGLLAAATAALVVSGMTAGASAEPAEPTVSRLIGGVLDDTVAALRVGDLPGTGPDGRYLLSSRDAVYLGFSLHGLLDELERAGLDVGAGFGQRVAIAPHRVLEADEVTAEVRLAIGSSANDPEPGEVEVARFDPRDRRARARYDEVRARAIRRLEAAGAPELVGLVDEVTLITGDPRVDFETRLLLDEMRVLGVPAAVFVSPPDPDA